MNPAENIRNTVTNQPHVQPTLQTQTGTQEGSDFVVQPVYEQPPSYNQVMSQGQTQALGQGQANMQPMPLNPRSDPLVHDINLIFEPNTPDGSRYPIRMQCPYCEVEIITSTDFAIGCNSCISFLACLIVCPPLAWMPLVMNDCKDVTHTCPNCKRSLGRYDLCAR